METGANANTWGQNTNTNLETIDAFNAGYLSKSVAGSADVTLTTNNADPNAEASNRVIEFTGALTGDIKVFVPAVENNYIFFNNTTGSQTLTVAPTGHASNGVVITQGAHTIMYNNANNEIKDLFSGSLGNLSLVSGGVFTGNASGASAINASNVASGTIADARLTSNVTLNNASTISTGTLPTAQVPDLSANKITSDTLSSDRLPTVPTTKGGTGLTAIGSAGQVIQVNSGGSALEFATPAGGLTNFQTRAFTSSTTYTPTSGTAFIRVYCVGGGGGGGGTAPGSQGAFAAGGGMGGNCGIRDYVATELGATASITIGAGGSGGPSQQEGGQGGTTSFNPAGTGVTLSAGGGVGAYSVNEDDQVSAPKDKTTSTSNATYVIPGGYPMTGGKRRRHSGQYIYSSSGGNSAFGFGANYINTSTGGQIASNGNTGQYGGGGSGSMNVNFAQDRTGGAGGSGIVVIEEYQ